MAKTQSVRMRNMRSYRRHAGKSRCRGKSLSRCRSMKTCKVARGPKRTFCRRKSNKHVSTYRKKTQKKRGRKARRGRKPAKK